MQPEQRWSKTGHAQGGFIRREDIQSSPVGTPSRCTVFPVTAKHNLRQVNLYHPIAARLQTPGAEVDFDSGDLDWLPKLADSIDLRASVEARSAVCPWGFDVSVGRLISEPENPATDARLAFTEVRSNFNLKEGQKVGIAVLFSEDSKPKASTIAGAFDFDLPVNEADIRRIYGRSGEVNIYTGKIKYVGVTQIEYDINSFTGCSWAVVFLLDEHQPEDSVQECDYGKAVAIHAGAHPSQGDRNYGFMLKHHPSLDY
jgi:hypothetical protein